MLGLMIKLVLWYSASLVMGQTDGSPTPNSSDEDKARRDNPNDFKEFTVLDLNKDGMVDSQELRAGEELDEVGEGEYLKLVSKLDRTCDGLITFQEYLDFVLGDD